MRRFYISSGDVDGIFDAEDPDAALVLAVQEWKAEEPLELATIMQIVEVTAEAELEWIDTETVLAKARIRRQGKPR